MSDNAVVKVDNASFSYDGYRVLEDVNFSVAEREFVCMVGPNGGGKSTLLKLMLGLLKPDAGSIRILGVAPVRARRRVGYVPQSVDVDPAFPVRVVDVALMGRLGRARGFGPYSRRDVEIAMEALDEVGLRELHARRLSSLSGGQRRRVFIARALATRPELLLLDEPTAGLDVKAEVQLLDLLAALNRSLTILLVSHNIDLVSSSVERVICVRKQVVVHPTGHIDDALLSDIYGDSFRIVRHDHKCLDCEEGKNGIH